LALRPAIRQRPLDSRISANGCSCREQIAHGTGRHAFHLAEIIQMALEEGPQGISDVYPEQGMVGRRRAAVASSIKRAGLGLAAIATAGGLLWASARR